MKIANISRYSIDYHYNMYLYFEIIISKLIKMLILTIFWYNISIMLVKTHIFKSFMII